MKEHRKRKVSKTREQFSFEVAVKLEEGQVYLTFLEKQVQKKKRHKVVVVPIP